MKFRRNASGYPLRIYLHIGPEVRQSHPGAAGGEDTDGVALRKDRFQKDGRVNALETGARRKEFIDVIQKEEQVPLLSGKILHESGKRPHGVCNPLPFFHAHGLEDSEGQLETVGDLLAIDLVYSAPEAPVLLQPVAYGLGQAGLADSPFPVQVDEPGFALQNAQFRRQELLHAPRYGHLPPQHPVHVAGYAEVLGLLG